MFMSMAGVSSPSVQEGTGLAPSSVQPGGGLCWQLELAWGRWRRAWLRRFRPDYVARMQARRQGECPNCPHDIIDPRDLKPWRNVCGYWFRPEDDPFRWRDRLGLARAGLAEVVVATLLALAVGALLLLLALGTDTRWAFLVPLPLLFWLAVLWFFRDPERIIPADPNVLVSPADGTVTYLGEVAAPDFPGGRAFCISIFLSLWDVHVNRLPCTARVRALRYFPGTFQDARRPTCATQNEQLWIDLEEVEQGRRLRVKQIAGAVARRIVCWLKVGTVVARGERLGMIKFGSRTELLLPCSEHEPFEVLIRVGERVRGGASALLRFTSTAGKRP
jgi:phosphatidylserine decarboxylase